MGSLFSMETPGCKKLMKGLLVCFDSILCSGLLGFCDVKSNLGSVNWHM